MSKKGLGKFLAGLAIGAGLGVLFAPKKGSETQKELKQKIEELMERAKETDIDEVKQTIEEKSFALKLMLSELDKETTLKMAKKKAKEIKDLSEEMVNYAVEKGQPVLQKTAEDLKAKALETTKEIIKELENK